MNALKKLFTTRKQRAIDEYNEGLAAKYRSEWAASLLHNQNAAKLNSEDQATWWNLGIAATALRNWPEARRAWKACGINLTSETGIVTWEVCNACVRICPNGAAETVWGDRLDPARVKIHNVPLPTSGRRYKDIVLADGAQNGTRTSNGYDYPVFDELELWQASPYATYEADLVLSGPEALSSLDRICIERDCAVEDWGSVRFLCRACSEGHPGEHTCGNDGLAQSRFGLASRSEGALRAILCEWQDVNPECALHSLELVVPAPN